MRCSGVILLIVFFLLTSVVSCGDRVVVVERLIEPGFVQGGIDPGDTDFEITLPTAGTVLLPYPGPFILTGKNIHYDSGIGALMVDLTVTNASPNAYPLPIKLEFISLLPSGVQILNSDNGIQGPGAVIQFHFMNEDLSWSPGETSLPRSVQFRVDPDVSIGFSARLHIGPSLNLGTIGGVVWNDANENGVRDANEPGLGNRGVILAYADTLFDCAQLMDCPIIKHAVTDTGGHYAFEDLKAGFYLLMLVRDRSSMPTTPFEIQVVLVETNGEVKDFLYGDFGVKLLQNGCGFVNGDFSDGDNFWMNESEGPGLGSGVEEIIDIDKREQVLHLNSQLGSNYYLFRTQRFSTCGILGHELSWEWKLASIEQSYGLAAVFIQFFDGAQAPLGTYFVRCHTGGFSKYACDNIVSEHVRDHPNMFVGCEERIGTSFDWMLTRVIFNTEFFAGLSGSVVNPNTIAEIKVWVESYNNAGSGVDAYFDNFRYLTMIVKE